MLQPFSPGVSPSNSRPTTPTSPIDPSQSQSSISSALVDMANGESPTCSAGSKPTDVSKLLAEIEWLSKEANDARANSDLWCRLRGQISSYFCDRGEVLVLAQRLGLKLLPGQWPTEDMCHVNVHNLTQYALKREEQIEKIKAAHPELDPKRAEAPAPYGLSDKDAEEEAAKAGEKLQSMRAAAAAESYAILKSDRRL